MTEARDLTKALGGKWYRSYGAAPCPACQPQRKQTQNALTLTDGHNGRLLLDCKKSGCAFLDILAAAGVRSGDYVPTDAATLAQREAEQRADAHKRAAQAKQVWNEAESIAGTIAETYLRGRGITCDLPQTLRFHPDCWHGPTAKCYPALVATVQGASLPAVHRTYLRTDGSGKANIDGAKLMLGGVAGGAVRLTEGPGPLVVSEGIETGLSVLSGLLSGPHSVWAALSTSGIKGLRLPAKPGKLIIASDGDGPGQAAGIDLASRANSIGWDVSLLSAPNGKDWNDVLRGEHAT